MPHYKYKKVVTGGSFGTTITHKNDDENTIITLGDYDGFTYLYAENLGDQPTQLKFQQIVLTKTELEFLRKYNKYLKVLEDSVQAKIRNLVIDYPQFEIDTFSTQENEAFAYSKDNTSLTPFIDNLCNSRGIDKNLMVQKILANAEALKLATAPIIGNYQRIVNAI